MLRLDLRCIHIVHFSLHPNIQNNVCVYTINTDSEFRLPSNTSTARVWVDSKKKKCFQITPDNYSRTSAHEFAFVISQNAKFTLIICLVYLLDETNLFRKSRAMPFVIAGGDVKKKTLM